MLFAQCRPPHAALTDRAAASPCCPCYGVLPSIAYFAAKANLRANKAVWIYYPPPLLHQQTVQFEGRRLRVFSSAIPLHISGLKATYLLKLFPAINKPFLRLSTEYWQQLYGGWKIQFFSINREHQGTYVGCFTYTLRTPLHMSHTHMYCVKLL